MTTATPPASPQQSRRKLAAAVVGVFVTAAVIGAVIATRNNDQPAEHSEDTPSTTAADSSATTSGSTADPSPEGTAPPETTTSSPNTTTIPAPAYVYPNIGNVAFYDGLAMGWWDGTSWGEMPSGIDGPIADPPVFAAQSVRYLAGTGEVFTREVSAMQEQCVEFGNMWTVGDDPTTEGLVGSTGDWELRPRPVEEIAADEAHRQAVRDVVEDQGVNDPEILIQQVVRVDVDGDGTDEVLISAEDIENPNTLLGEPEGSYSMVLLRRVTPDGVDTISLSSFVVTAEGADDGEDFSGFMSYSRLVDVADLNGDGVFEAVIQTGYYEGGSVAIYALDGSSSVTVGAGCGV